MAQPLGPVGLPFAGTTNVPTLQDFGGSAECFPLYLAEILAPAGWKRGTDIQPACVVGALAPYNHGVPLAGVLGWRILAA